jgi:drug/metabolite transporter (DMT)-like permease
VSASGAVAHHLRCAAWMMAMSLAFALQVNLIRKLSVELPVPEITFWRNTLGIALFVPWLWRAGWAGLRTARVGLYVTRSAILVVSSLTLAYSVVLLPVAEATALTFTQGLFATVMAIVVLREVVGAPRWISLAVGFAGVLVMLRPGAAAIDVGALVALASALSFGGVIVVGKLLARAGEPAERVTVYLWLIAGPLTLVPALFVWQWPAAGTWPWLLALGVLASVNQYAYFRALEAADASFAMPFDFLRLPFTAFIAYLAFGQVLDAWTWVGAAVIFVSSVYVTRSESRNRAAAAR